VKPEGLASGANALRYWQARQNVVANNLANAETHGFKGERVFARLLGDMVSPEAVTDLRQGALMPTERPLDLAIDGDGFFVVDTPAGQRLSRGGPFKLDTDGTIVDAAGNALLGEDGPIRIPESKGEVSVDEAGVVRVDGAPLDRLRIEVPGADARLQHEGHALFLAEGGTETVADDGRKVLQGHLESSNVNTMQSMVDMIDIQRNYAAVHNSMGVVDGMMDTIANRIGRLG
jgi:flagellar basal body rod protein FlgG